MPLYDWINSNLHNDNQDWIIGKIKNIETAETTTTEAAATATDSAATATEAATAAAGSAASASGSAATAQDLVDQLDTGIAKEVSDWLEENITPTTPAIDKTLTIEGAAADAKATGDAIDAITSESGNLAFFTNTATRTLSNGATVSFPDASTIVTNGTTSNASVNMGMMGNANVVANTFQPNLQAGTYIYTQNVTIGTADASGTAMYYRPNAETNWTIWSSNQVHTFETAVEVAYRVTANHSFAGRVCRLMLFKGNELPYAFYPYGKTADDVVARSQIAELISNFDSDAFIVPDKFTASLYFNGSAYSGSHEMQGVCTDGSYLYYGMHPAEDADYSALGKIDLATGELVKEVNNHTYGHCNGMCYYPARNELIIASLDDVGTMHIADADSLEYKGSYSMQAILENTWKNESYGSYSGVGGIGYSAELDKFIYLLRKDDANIFWGFAITDANNNLEKLIKCQNVTKTTFLRGGLDCDENYIYMTEQDQTGSQRVAKIVIYDYNGAIVDTMSITTSGSLIEGVAKLNNSEFYISYANDNIFKLTIDSTKAISAGSVMKKYNFN